MVDSVFQLVDDLVNERIPGDHVYLERIGEYVPWSQVPALEEKVADWSKEDPVIWNVGMGAAASFAPTLRRLLSERINDLYGPYEHTIRVRLTPAVAAGCSAAQHWLAVEVLMEMAQAATREILPPLLRELKQLASEESYRSYGSKISDKLMFQALGREYVEIFGSSDPSVQWDPDYGHQPRTSPLLQMVREGYLQGKKYLLLVENLQVPVSLDVLAFLVGPGKRPSIYQQNRWLISAVSRDVCNRSHRIDQATRQATSSRWFNLSSEYYHAPVLGRLRPREGAVLISEALWDAANSIHRKLRIQEQQQRDLKFWFHVAQQCLYYSVLYHPQRKPDALFRPITKTSRTSPTPVVTSDELVRCWVAEGLLSSSVASPTDIPAAAASKKESNKSYYRSAYEVGEVVFQALQEYSLLPICPVPEDAATGASKIAEGVPGLKELAELYDLDDKGKQLRWVSFLDGRGRHVSRGWGEQTPIIPREVAMTTLVLRGHTNTSIAAFHFHKVWNSHLHVLDLSYTKILHLPPGLCQLVNLRLLSLRGCSKLDTSEDETPGPLSYLENLEVLDINSVPLLVLTREDGRNKSKLHFIDLLGSKISTLPSEFFDGMSSLEELILGNCSKLEELPHSVVKLSNLLVLHVEGTMITNFPEDTFEAMQRLETLKLINNSKLSSLPRSLSEAKCLRELHIYNCISLSLQDLWKLLSYLEDLYIETWKALKDIKIHEHRNLRTFSLSGPCIRRLSLRGCSRLKTVNFSDDLRALEDVDLSGTAIEEVPPNLPNLPQLRKVHLLNVQCFKRFPWHQVVRFPKVFYLDDSASDDNQFLKIHCQQRTCAAENYDREERNNTAQININDPGLFHSFNSDAANKLVKEGQFLQHFIVQVKPRSVRCMEPKNKSEICTKIQKQSPYLDVHSFEVSSIVPMMKLQPKRRHVEISANNQYPHGLRHLLSVTKSIFIGMILLSDALPNSIIV
ncbi:uncharacterized protein LOC120643782 [Panicum virgatum]|uniref:Disease resistance R13L4/SHOC-2-like LRR domain-containing protein n=1 Tax=Panicum virgatum TaxID=38727 RepID=A0A8T0PNB3_PANVG|nr:uncharacterized protein LOC120643782 [Panicum virgatum]KAG2560565.1 hypothetical protein PVAP13_8KG103196 [Panicum virgatum]KAG2560566.1 hypothetical protein PVAP13_8KG103196 [Panicum virgatum]